MESDDGPRPGEQAARPGPLLPAPAVPPADGATSGRSGAAARLVPDRPAAPRGDALVPAALAGRPCATPVADVGPHDSGRGPRLSSRAPGRLLLGPGQP